MRTIYDIEADYSRERTDLLREYHRKIDDVRAASVPEGVPYLDKLTPQARDEVLREQKDGAKDKARERALARYREATEWRREQIEARKSRLERELFRVAGTPGEAALPHAAPADEEGLMGLLDAAVIGGSADQARAVLAVAHRRGMPAIVSAYLEGADPRARALRGVPGRAHAGAVRDGRRAGGGVRARPGAGDPALRPPRSCLVGLTMRRGRGAGS